MNGPRPYVLHEANYRQLLDYRPNVAVLPWGATEAHNYHLPHGTDVVEAGDVAAAAAGQAYAKGGKPIVLPTIPFGNNGQQLDQVATIHCSTSTAKAILWDVATSLTTQGIDRLVILNGHGGNEFKPLVRDLQFEFELLVIVVNFWDRLKRCTTRYSKKNRATTRMKWKPVCCCICGPSGVVMDQAGPGARIPFELKSLAKVGAWTPRPWSKVHPDTGSGDPSRATAEKGKRYFEAIAGELAEMLLELSQADKGQLPYC